MKILTKLKSLFKKPVVVTQKTARELLQERSTNAVCTIRTIITSLKDASKDIAAERDANVKKMEELAEENKFYDTLEADNGKIIANFESLLK